MEIVDLQVYPIKSLGGVSLESSQAYEKGLEHDRRWMLVDEDGTFMSQRTTPQLALFHCELMEDGIRVTYNEEDNFVPFDLVDKNIHRVSVWSSKLKANEVSSELSLWFSDRLNQKLTLTKMTDISKRPKRLYTAPFKTNVSFADGYPYLFLGTSSMELLNSKLDEAVGDDRFRANIIVNTSDPHEEDKWREEFVIGTAKFKVVKACARCVMTTIDQQTAEKSPEPLKTLSEYRKKRNKIWFGANAICVKQGRISVGDEILIH